MTRVKRGIVAHKKREKTLKYTKGFRWGRRTKERAAKEALVHAWSHAFRGRKERKRVFRTKWHVQINAASRGHGVSYSILTSLLKKSNIGLNRKMLAELAIEEPGAFKQLIAKVKQ
ncbi:MAG: 50S ribosomal protein L20 [Candidatus Harrisonbacteria bacterium RIFOXYD1_FULL_40_9]|uniref:Large ribosomal subunit protein bL20 n=1 Tax=Candidatus Harrisonbacteria bacterium RIFOXYD1_FULL_40_9 TaxID=1798412 RepID=A0A1G1ZYU8_9BACT|nr:MAG: 50S ribosomal protein L20 [Candidatus Harrisonbacteria bacterium RIFOXYD1_FULL_40_9]